MESVSESYLKKQQQHWIMVEIWWDTILVEILNIIVGTDKSKKATGTNRRLRENISISGNQLLRQATTN